MHVYIYYVIKVVCKWVCMFMCVCVCVCVGRGGGGGEGYVMCWIGRFGTNKTV